MSFALKVASANHNRSSVHFRSVGSQNHHIYVPDGKTLEQACGEVETMVIGAHSDDAEILGGPELIKHYANGKGFASFIVTDGSCRLAASPGLRADMQEFLRAGGYAFEAGDDISQSEIDASIKMRQQEQLDAAKIGKYSLAIQLAARVGGDLSKAGDIHDKLIKGAQAITSDIVQVLQHTKPKTIITHQPFDLHPHHLGLLMRTMEAVLSMPKEQRPQHFYGGMVWDKIPSELGQDDRLPNGVPVLVHEMVNSTAHDGVWEKTLQCFRSQTKGHSYYEATAGIGIGEKVLGKPFVTTASDQGNCLIKRLDLMPIIERADELIKKRIPAAAALDQAYGEYYDAVIDCNHEHLKGKKEAGLSARNTALGRINSTAPTKDKTV